MMRMPENCLRRAHTGWEKKSVMAFVKRGAHGRMSRARRMFSGMTRPFRMLAGEYRTRSRFLKGWRILTAAVVSCRSARNALRRLWRASRIARHPPR